MLFHKGARGKVEYDVVADEATEPEGTHAIPFDNFVSGEMPAAWAGNRVWDDAAGEPRLPTSTENLESARRGKLNELEAQFQKIAEAQFGTSTYAGIMIYFELPNDPRTVAVKAARTNFLQKSQALADLGRPGKPALTEANIAAVTW